MRLSGLQPRCNRLHKMSTNSVFWSNLTVLAVSHDSVIAAETKPSQKPSLKKNLQMKLLNLALKHRQNAKECPDIGIQRW